MNQYKTIYNEVYDIDTLSVREKRFLRKAGKYFKTNPDWNKFSNFWHKEIEDIFRRKPAKKMIDSPVYRICEDLESRLGVKQGYAKAPDYRDLLEELIDAQYPSRYKFCKENAIREDLISRALNKQRNLSIETLQKILKALHYEIYYREIPTLRKVKEKDKFVNV